MGVLAVLWQHVAAIHCSWVKGIKPLKLVVGVILIKVSEWRERWSADPAENEGIISALQRKTNTLLGSESS